MSGLDISTEVAAALAEAGAEVGAGIPLVVYLLKDGAATGPEWDPQPGAPTEHPFIGLDQHEVVREMGQGWAKSRGSHILKLAVNPANPDPAIGDNVRVVDTVYSIASVRPIQPGGFVLYWEVTLDR